MGHINFCSEYFNLQTKNPVKEKKYKVYEHQTLRLESK